VQGLEADEVPAFVENVPAFEGRLADARRRSMRARSSSLKPYSSARSTPASRSRRKPGARILATETRPRRPGRRGGGCQNSRAALRQRATRVKRRRIRRGSGRTRTHIPVHARPFASSNPTWFAGRSLPARSVLFLSLDCGMESSMCRTDSQTPAGPIMSGSATKTSQVQPQAAFGSLGSSTKPSKLIVGGL
jgi:hypothetical protein